MKLYHTSNIEVIKPRIECSRNYLDFGKGFYLTSLREQALNQLQYKRPNHQVCITNQLLIDKYLKFLFSEKL